METDMLQLLLRHNRQRMEDIEQALATGGARNYDEYCRMVGRYSALKDVEDDIKDMEKRVLEA